jgi:hypothetical protein
MSVYAVSAVLTCPGFTPAQVSELISQGELPELAQVRNLSLVDIDTGPHEIPGQH